MGQILVKINWSFLLQHEPYVNQLIKNQESHSKPNTTLHLKKSIITIKKKKRTKNHRQLWSNIPSQVSGRPGETKTGLIWGFKTDLEMGLHGGGLDL